MRALIQRVQRGSVAIEGRLVAQIGRGYVILLGVAPEDGEENATALARKIAGLRIFADHEEKMNLSLRDVGGEALVVSQFTLYADTRKGNRPSFTGAAVPDQARRLVTHFCAMLTGQGVPVQQGIFGAHMQVEILNDGPVTIWLEM
jgi:D-tyrosyl-tRNA(Tyr) deacylase